jgi:glycerol-3-phosphate acyltransferase PlsY
VILSYLIGSIPFGYILVRFFQGRDVRESGSGNIGATNVARSSPALGVVTLLLDAGKGSLAVVVAVLISRTLGAGYSVHNAVVLAALAALVAVLGHMFPVWLKFKGGKGVATGLGSFAVIAPKTTLIMIGLFAITLFAFRLVSLSSVISVLLFPLPVWLLHEYHDEPLVLALISACSIMIVLKHHGNIRRLVSGAEPHFQLGYG